MYTLASHYESMYGSPRASMMSRDPDGIEPNATMEDSVVGLEPVGSRAEEAMSVPTSLSNVENVQIPSSRDIADLVGAPPPPPSMPPPKRVRRRIPRIQTKVAAPKPVNDVFGSSDDDSLLQDLARSSSTMTTPRSIQHDIEPIPEFLLPIIDATGTTQSDDSLKVDPPPPDAMVELLPIEDVPDVSPTSKVVEERVKAALALYEREDLVLEDNHDFIELTPSEVLRSVTSFANEQDNHQDVLRPIVAFPYEKEGKGESPTSLRSPSMAGSPASSKSSRSPRSPQSNKPSPPAMVKNTNTKSRISDAVVSPKADSPEAPVPVARGRRQVPAPRRTASVERRHQKEQKKKRDQKRGFFKKLFGGRGKNRVEEEYASVAASVSDVSDRWSPIHQAPVESPKAPLKPALKTSEQRQYQGKAFAEPSPSQQEYLDHPDDELLDGSGNPVEFFSRGQHNDPPVVVSGRRDDLVDEEYESPSPVKSYSPGANSVASREMDGVSPKTETDPQIMTRWSDQDGADFLPHGQEASPVARGGVEPKSFDPSGGRNTNVGSKSPSSAIDDAKEVDAFTTNFFGNPSSLPTPNNDTRLRVVAPGPSQDPAGASPMQWKYSGKPPGVPKFRDPIGDSPVHAWKDTDPPLTVGFEDRTNDLHDEKKEDDPFPPVDQTDSNNSATPFEQDFMDEEPPKVQESVEDKATIEVPRTQKSVPDKAAPLRLETDMEKSGFKSASNTPVAGANNKSLTISTAAFTNAMAVAYLHRLQGEPSPRHTWHSSTRQTTEPSPLALKAKSQKESKKKQYGQTWAKKKPSPADYGAHNAQEVLLGSDDAVTSKPPVNHEEIHTIKSRRGALFGAYASKFQGRRPMKKQVPVLESPTSRLALVSRSRPSLEFPLPAERGNFYASMKPGKITASAVSRGIQMRRMKRDEDIALGKSERVVLTPKPKTEGRNRFHFFHYNDETEIKDPIQRAGRRILSKSALKIQCTARRYIARREAVDRMWALIEIQSYYRRWRAEANRHACVDSAVQIQKSFRGWLARSKLKDMNHSATQIQKIVRGYLCQAKVYDSIFYIVRLQALVRGCCVRMLQQKRQYAAVQVQRHLRGYKVRWDNFRSIRATPFQSLYRGYKARQDFFVAVASAKLLQAAWRSWSARISYQVEIVDIIITQSVVRRWLASRHANRLRDTELFYPASIIQAAWRGRCAREHYEEQVAARMIQTAWRRFRCNTDFIFTIVDILIVQRTARVFLAKKETNKRRQEKAAVRIQCSWRRYKAQSALLDFKAARKIQCCWRRHKAESTLLYSLVNIIITQSLARRFLAKAVAEDLRRKEANRHAAATAIQKTWRKFWDFSHYIIVQYEVARLQALFRGKLARQSYNLKLGCAIIIQATIRRHLAKKAIMNKILSEANFHADTLALRERNAAKKVQFWWRIVLDWTKEKKAALTIERFFIHVRAEVDREIMRRERKKLLKQEKRRQQRRDDDKMLEKAWLKTVDENTSITIHSGDGRSQSAPRLRHDGGSLAIVTHRTPRGSGQMMSPKGGSVGQEVDINGWPIQRMETGRTPRSRPPTDAVVVAPSEDYSEVSNITNPSVFNRPAGPPGRYDSGHSRTSRRMSTEDYIKKYGGASGLVTAPNRISSGTPKQHFFSDEPKKVEKTAVPAQLGPVVLPPTPQGLGPVILPPTPQSIGPVILPPTPRSISGTPVSRLRSSSTPRAQHSDGFGQVTQGSFSFTGRGKSSGGVTTPHNNYGHSLVPQTPRSSASPRIQVGFPPATPRGYKGGNHKMHISRRDTAETESHTTYTQNSVSKSSPHVGQAMHGNGPAVKTMNYLELSQSYTNDGEDLMFLEGEALADEYGEV